jgi:hypothetical protein
VIDFTTLARVLLLILAAGIAVEWWTRRRK